MFLLARGGQSLSACGALDRVNLQEQVARTTIFDPVTDFKQRVISGGWKTKFVFNFLRGVTKTTCFVVSSLISVMVTVVGTLVRVLVVSW